MKSKRILDVSLKCHPSKPNEFVVMCVIIILITTTQLLWLMIENDATS